MAETAIDLQITDDIYLPYETGAELWLDDYLWPFWAALLEVLPDLTLDPLITGVDAAALWDLTDMARMLDNEPPNAFALFTVNIDEAWADTLLPLIRGLPFVLWAGPRVEPKLPVLAGYDHNPRVRTSTHLRPASLGHDVMHAWRIPGGTGEGVIFTDVEGDFDYGHQDIDGGVMPISYFPSAADAVTKSHGTASLGMVVSRNNSLGSVGIAPKVSARFVSERRATMRVNTADAIFTAAVTSVPHGIVLIEMAMPFAPLTGPDVMQETSFIDFLMIQFASGLGVTVIEPAGNAGVDLDSVPAVSGQNSGAVVVGGAVVSQAPTGDLVWSRQSSYGTRVDCFSQFRDIFAPGGATSSSYWETAKGAGTFSGTSGASAIVAGLACSIQGMAIAHGGALRPGDIRRLLSDTALGTLTAPGQPGGIGAMPDLRRIANDQGWRQIVPYAIVSSFANNVQAFSIVDEFLLGQTWGMTAPPPLPAGNILGRDTFFPAQTPATARTRWATKTWLDIAAISDNGGVHHLGWRDGAAFGDFEVDRCIDTLPRGHDLAIARTPHDDIVVAAIDLKGSLVAMNGASRPNLVTDLSSSIIIDNTSTYLRTPGPVLLARSTNKVEIVAIDDNGVLRWAESSVIDADTDAAWGPSIPQGLPDFAPTAKPGFIAIGAQGMAILGVSDDRHLYFWALSLPLSESLDIFPDIEFATEGPVGLAARHEMLIAAAVGSDKRIYVMFRQIDETSTWFGHQTISPDVEVSRLGGVQVVVQAYSISVHAILPDGRACRADYLSNVGWGRLQPVE